MQREQAVMELTLTDPFSDVAREFVKPRPRVPGSVHGNVVAAFENLTVTIHLKIQRQGAKAARTQS